MRASAFAIFYLKISEASLFAFQRFAVTFRFTGWAFNTPGIWLVDVQFDQVKGFLCVWPNPEKKVFIHGIMISNYNETVYMTSELIIKSEA